MVSMIDEMSEKETVAQLSSLPAEICTAILQYLEPEAATALAKCSRYFYFVAFPIRIPGIKLDENDYKRRIKPFIGRGWLVPLRPHIRSIDFSLFDVDALHVIQFSASKFSNLRRITVRVFAHANLKRNIYVALFSLLSTLPSYDNITHFAFKWAGIEAKWHNDIEQYHRLPESERNTEGLYRWTTRKFTRTRDLLGPYLSEEMFASKMHDISLRLPNKLQSFGVDVRASDDMDYLIPVLNTPSITNLYIRQVSPYRSALPIFPPEQFPTIKALILEGDQILVPKDITLDAKQFPNLETLMLRKIDWVSTEDVFWQPRFPKLKRLEIPRFGGKYGIDYRTLEPFIREMLKDRNCPSIRICVFHGTQDLPAGREKISVTCKISESKTQDADNGPWELHWEGDVNLDQEAEKKFWDSLGKDFDDEQDPDYVKSEAGYTEGSEFSGDSEYPNTGDELYPIDTDEFSDGGTSDDGNLDQEAEVATSLNS